MANEFPSKFLKDVFTEHPEIAICDLTQFQIVIPTRTIPNKTQNILGISLHTRLYRKQGWVFASGRLFGELHNLCLSAPVPHSSPFKIHPRIANGLPLSFELKTRRALPPSLASEARLLYRFDEEPPFHYALFQRKRPRFVRIYPFRSRVAIAAQVTQFLREERAFMQQNSSQLRRSQFYRDEFGV